MMPLKTYGSTVVRITGTGALVYECGLQVDADGSPRAYHPKGSPGLDGLDYLADAGSPGKWWGIATDNGKMDGNPIIQGPNDLAPGFYVSTTALENPQFALGDPRRYIDSERVPYIVLPGGLPSAPKLGAQALVINLRNQSIVRAIFADIGPRDKIGEGSIALAVALGIPANPRTGGCSDGILTIVFPA